MEHSRHGGVRVVRYAGHRVERNRGRARLARRILGKMGSEGKPAVEGFARLILEHEELLPGESYQWGMPVPRGVGGRPRHVVVFGWTAVGMAARRN